jgi:hypothetical protein
MPVANETWTVAISMLAPAENENETRDGESVCERSNCNTDYAVGIKPCGHVEW